MKRIIITSLLVLLSLGLVYVGYHVYSFFTFLDDIGECGFDDGPFVAVRIDTTINSAPDESIQFQEKQLLVYNNKDSLPPVICLKEKGVVVMNLKMDLSSYGTHLWEVSNVSIKSLENPLEIQFVGTWTFGAERGRMKIDKITGENTYCLSW